MNSTKYIGMDVHKEVTTIAVLDPSGRLVMESIVETKGGDDRAAGARAAWGFARDL